MTYSLRYLDKAKRDLDGLESTARERVRESIENLAANPFPRGTRKLEG